MGLGEPVFDRFEADLRSEETESTLSEHITLARSLPIQGFPSLVMEHAGQYKPVSIDYLDYRPMLTEIQALID